ncbi:MAG: EutN/CcmL family microcompartment protein [Candidatus Marinimicrobia bacterium]|nr:EutN/CcmL family microcompartment protein [Candidatus Neomarinimicrobiota bacterium]
MRLGLVTGKVWATQKPETLKGKKFLVVQPKDFETLENSGDPLVAVDTVKAGIDTWVFYVMSREATIPLANSFNPIDASIIGIVDRIDLKDKMINL